MKGAGGYGSENSLLRWYTDAKFRAAEQAKLEDNYFCQHGKRYQGEGAAQFSLDSGITLAPLGLVVGTTDCYGSDISFLSATYDYIGLQTGMVCEIKCPQKLHNKLEKYFVQCQVQLQIAKHEKMHLVLYVPEKANAGAEICYFEVVRDDGWWRLAFGHMQSFWHTVCQ